MTARANSTADQQMGDRFKDDMGQTRALKYHHGFIQIENTARTLADLHKTLQCVQKYPRNLGVGTSL